MKFTTTLARHRKAKADPDQNGKSPTRQTAEEQVNLAPNDVKHDTTDNKKGETVSDNQSTISSPAGSPRRKPYLEEDTSSKDAAPSSPKHSLTTIMSSMKKATAWSEMTTTSIKVPTVARIVWLANRGRWLALDQLLEKLCVEDAQKVDLNIEASLLGVCFDCNYFIEFLSCTSSN